MNIIRVDTIQIVLQKGDMVKMYFGLIFILLLIFILPLTVKIVEENLEIFLFIMGAAAIIISKSISIDFFGEVLRNKFLYMITAAVLLGGFLFRYINEHMRKTIDFILEHVPLKLVIFILIIFIGLFSSIITAIVAALFLVEILDILPLDRKEKVTINVIACFAIGLGTVLTPIGEPLSTIVFSKLHLEFWYMVRHLGAYIFPAIILLGVLGTFYGNKREKSPDDVKVEVKIETNKEIIMKAVKVFAFVIALEMLGKGFTPFVDKYIVNLDGRILFWINMSSAILDNATLAAAEISVKMTPNQIYAILLGLLISGGMMIPGNIPNIISASKLKIKSKEWIRVGVPLGLIMLVIYYIILFII